MRKFPLIIDKYFNYCSLDEENDNDHENSRRKRKQQKNPSKIMKPEELPKGLIFDICIGENVRCPKNGYPNTQANM